MNRYKGRRFFAFLLVVGCIMLAYYLHHPETFQALVNGVTAMFATYIAGQSATDWKQAGAANERTD